MSTLIEIIGWAGAALILLAYALISMGKLGVHTRLYHAMNMLGAAGFIVNSGWNGAYPSAALNIVWLAIGAYSLLKLRSSAAGR